MLFLRLFYPNADQFYASFWGELLLLACGTSIAFGKPLEPRYKLENAEVIVSLDSDFLSATEPGQLPSGAGAASSTSQ